jgi:hypothetical protein
MTPRTTGRGLACALAFMVLAAGGCATYAWTKPGVEATAAEQDLRECHRQARMLSWDVESSFWASPWSGHGMLAWRSPLWIHDRWHDPFWARPDPFWRMDLERRLVDRCMYAKGYDLEKVERHAGSS